MAPFAFSCRLLDSFLKAALRIQLAATSLSLPVGFVVTAVLALYFDNLSLCPSRGRLSIRVQRKISRVPSFIMGLDRSVSRSRSCAAAGLSEMHITCRCNHARQDTTPNFAHAIVASKKLQFSVPIMTSFSFFWWC